MNVCHRSGCCDCPGDAPSSVCTFPIHHCVIWSNFPLYSGQSPQSTGKPLLSQGNEKQEISGWQFLLPIPHSILRMSESWVRVGQGLQVGHQVCSWEMPLTPSPLWFWTEVHPALKVLSSTWHQDWAINRASPPSCEVRSSWLTGLMRRVDCIDISSLPFFSAWGVHSLVRSNVV